MRQNTFTIVPNPLGMQGLVQRPAGKSPASHRPMTSKQAQKLHRQTNRGPKLSKAEQRRLEREEQERIRKELDKEKQANKAVLLREKKKAREQEIAHAKKRKGLPLVDVHPSQDTITRFVRGNGTSKKRDAAGAAVQLEAVRQGSPAYDSAPEVGATEDEHDLDKHKAQQLDTQMQDAVGSDRPPPSSTKRLRTNREEAENKSFTPNVVGVRSQNGSVESSGSAVDNLLRSQILEDVLSATNDCGIRQDPAAQNTHIPSQARVSPGKENKPPGPRAAISPELLAQESTRGLGEEQHLSQRKTFLRTAAKIRNMTTGQPATSATSSASPRKGTSSKRRGCHSSAEHGPLRETVRTVDASRTSAVLVDSVAPSNLPAAQTSEPPKPLLEITANCNRPSMNRGRFNEPMKPAPTVGSATKLLLSCSKLPMPPPPLPFKSPNPSIRERSKGPKFLPKHLQTPLPRPPLAKPLQPVQALHSSVNDPPLPTSTQLFLLSNLDDIFPSPSQELRELQEAPVRPPPLYKPKRPLWKPPSGFLGSAARTRHDGAALPRVCDALPQNRPPVLPPGSHTRPLEDPPVPFFLTQDFVLSSQDIRDLDDATETPCKPRNRDMCAATVSERGSGQRDEPQPSNLNKPMAVKSTMDCGNQLGQGHNELTPELVEAPNEPRNCSQFSRPPRYSLRKSQPRTPVCSSGSPLKGSQHAKSLSRGTHHTSDLVQSNCASAHPVDPTPVGSGSSSLALASHPEHVQADPPQPASPPPKRRFFTSSNMAIHLAMEKSMRTHKEEQRKRQAEQRVLELAGRKEQEDENNRQISREQEEIRLLAQLAEAVDDEEEDLNLPSADGEAFTMDADIEAELLEMDCDLVDVPSATSQPRAPGSRDTEGYQAVVPRTGLDDLEERARTCMASQETDYGDLDVTIEDLDQYF